MAFHREAQIMKEKRRLSVSRNERERRKRSETRVKRRRMKEEGTRRWEKRI